MRAIAATSCDGYVSQEFSERRFHQSRNKGYDYSVPDGTYTVKFPGKPEEETQTVPRQLGPAKILTVFYRADGGSVSIP